MSPTVLRPRPPHRHGACGHNFRTSAESTTVYLSTLPGFTHFVANGFFRDDTARIISSIWPDQPPRSGTKVIELGCGPGFYSRKLALRFPADRRHRRRPLRKPAPLGTARGAITQNVSNCVFERVNALALPIADASFDVLIASRIFTVLPDHHRAVGEMFRVLKSGGRCFVGRTTS